MKKLLSVLAAVGLTATASSAVVACGSSSKVASTSIKFNSDYFKDWGKGQNSESANKFVTDLNGAVNKENGFYKKNGQLARLVAKAGKDDNGLWKDKTDADKMTFAVYTVDNKDFRITPADFVSNVINNGNKKEVKLNYDIKMVSLSELVKSAKDKDVDSSLKLMLSDASKADPKNNKSDDVVVYDIAKVADLFNKVNDKKTLFNNGNDEVKVEVTIPAEK